MKAFIAFTYQHTHPEGESFICNGSVVVEGIPQSTAKLRAIEDALWTGLKKSNQGHEFTKPALTAVVPLPMTSEPKEIKNENRIIQLRE